MIIAFRFVRFSLALVLCLVTWSMLSFRVNAAPISDEPRSSIAILVDLSQTWHNDRSRSINKSTLQSVMEATINLGERFEAPVHIVVLPIGDSSLLRPPLCRALYAPKLISPPTSANSVFTQSRSLRKYLMTDCIQFILSRPKEKFTDISGAVASAERISTNQHPSQRAIIILSDMLEERPKGQPAPVLSLRGFNILILYRVLDEDRRQPPRLDKRLEEWDRNLKAAGGRVTIVPDQGITEGSIVRFLRP